MLITVDNLAFIFPFNIINILFYPSEGILFNNEYYFIIIIIIRVGERQ